MQSAHRDSVLRCMPKVLNGARLARLLGIEARTARVTIFTKNELLWPVDIIGRLSIFEHDTGGSMRGTCCWLLPLSLFMWCEFTQAQGLSLSCQDGRGGRITATWLSPAPQGNVIRDIFFLDNDNGWAVGEWGTVMHTRDGGANWELQYSGSTDTFVEVDFSSPDCGWIRGKRGLLHTNDGGNVWRPVELPQRSVGKVVFVGDMIALSDDLAAVLTDEGLWTTRDRGANWTCVRHFKGATAMYMRDDRFWWVCYDHGHIAISTDEGGTWVESWIIRPGPDIVSLVFTDTLHGWACDDRVLYRSTDGGRIWLRSDGSYKRTLNPCSDGQLYPLRINDFQVVDSLRLWFACSDGLWNSVDGGVSLRRVLKTESACAAVHVGAEGGAWASCFSGELITSGDGGWTWSEIHDGPTDIFLESIFFPTPDIGIAISRSGIHRSTDGGSSWIGVNAVNDTLLRCMSFGSPGNGCIVGDGGRILLTSDSGRTWSSFFLPEGSDLRSVFFLNAHLGWIGAADGALLVTRDGGRMWDLQACLDDKDLSNIHFADEWTGYCTGRTGVLRRSIDGGATWREMDIGDGLRAGKILTRGTDMVDVLAKSTVDQSAVILHSSDRGTSWSRQSLNPAQWATRLSFLDGQRGLLLTFSAGVFVTSDGGMSWQPLPLPFYFWIADMAIRSDSSVLLVGNGVIRVDWQGMAE